MFESLDAYVAAHLGDHLQPTSAGTGPMYDLGMALDVPIVSIGGGYWGSRSHAPDENIRLADSETIYMMARLIERFAG